jgi:2-polyprenyl-3-methyl-5-hydroxy-6-metoxy-1,4-benzoquinol methylase
MKFWKNSAQTLPFVREHFRKKASSFDQIYDREESPVQVFLRPGLFKRRDAALDLLKKYENPRVLDIGCGSGRVGELLLEHGAASYVGVDFSEPMLELAKGRLERFWDKVSLEAGDFVDVVLEPGFDVIIALGVFDYIAEPNHLLRRAFELCSGCFFGTFPSWTWIKGPVRYLKYQVFNDCPIYNYTARELDSLHRAAGFSMLDIRRQHSGYFVFAQP